MGLLEKGYRYRRRDRYIEVDVDVDRTFGCLKRVFKVTSGTFEGYRISCGTDFVLNLRALAFSCSLILYCCYRAFSYHLGVLCVGVLVT